MTLPEDGKAPLGRGFDALFGEDTAAAETLLRQRLSDQPLLGPQGDHTRCCRSPRSR